MRPSVATGLVAFAGYSLLAWPTPGWFDGGEFVAATWGLGVSHPPGHPLHAITAAFFVRLPLGPLSLRVALASAAATALAIGLVVETVDRAARSLDVPAGPRASWAALAGAIFGVSVFAVGQAVRPEVYGLALAAVCATMLAAVRFWVRPDARDLAAGGLAIGLGGANHHLLALLAVPSLLVAASSHRGGRDPRDPSPPGPPARSGGVPFEEDLNPPALAEAAWHDDRDRARRGLVAGAAMAGVALLAYAYLPLRASSRWSVSSPTALAEIWDVVRARVYQGALLGDAPGGLGTRFADVGAILVLGTGGLFVFVSLAGIYVSARSRELRRLAPIVGLPIALYPIVRAWLGFSRNNPDAEGYLAPAVAAMAVAIGVLCCAGHALARRPGGPGRGVVLALAMLALVAGGLAGAETVRRGAAEDGASAAYAEAVLGDLPVRATVLLSGFETAFALAGAQATDDARPDVDLVVLPFIAYPGRARAMVLRDPRLRDFVRGWLLAGELPETELAALAADRPVVLEADPHAAASVRAYLVPSGPLCSVHGEPRAPADLAATADAHFQKWERLYARLGQGATRGETNRLLAYRHFQDAIVYASRGERESAGRSVALAERHAPRAREIVRLRAALGRGRGSVDVDAIQPPVR